MKAIDRMEDAMAPIDPAIANVRGLITGLELCHHKAERWVANIIEAIGKGETTKGLGTRSAPDRHRTSIRSSVCGRTRVLRYRRGVQAAPSRVLIFASAISALLS
ncbi:MAG: hypothetical protein ACYTA3_14475 [Planctomycetota bacterium]|jgi:hypothetical protein